MIDFWTWALALTIFLYVILDGFDLGVGMLMVLVPEESDRRGMLSAIAPVWDGNETWLILNATILFGVFPLTYSTLLSAFYLPLLVMLAALIFRGVSFEFRDKSERTRALWDKAFIGGSYLATFIQGATAGALVKGLPMSGNRYVGGPFGWLSPFALLCGLGLCAGYALLGAGWLAYKATGSVQALAFRLLPRLQLGVVGLMLVLLAAALVNQLAVMHRWIDRPVLAIFPIIGILASIVMAMAVRQKREGVPFLCGVTLFAAAMGTLAVSFYPYMIPFAITVDQAASPHSTLAFLFWGAGVFVLPLTLIYTLTIYFVFKGKVELSEPTY
jgi:cytochrome bd ubiquinol oxidase subunit II